MISASSHLLTLSIGFLLLSLIGIAIGVQFHATKRYQRHVRDGLTYLSSFRQLLNLIQQHRGVSNGVLCGDTTLSSRLPVLQAEVNDQITWLNNNNSWLAHNPNWQGIVLHWQQLSRNYSTLTSMNCVSQHSKMIANLLYLIDDSCEYHKLYELKNTDGDSVRYLWQDQLEAAEWVGQARAVGTGVAATGQCSSVERIRLKYLHTAIKENLNALHVDNDAKLIQLLEVIDLNLLSPAPHCSAEYYFDLATAAIEQIYTSFDQQLLSISQKSKWNSPSSHLLTS
jgi:hypothetical protein